MKIINIMYIRSDIENQPSIAKQVKIKLNFNNTCQKFRKRIKY